ncbi:hypothetical protein S40285_04732 [Stachybotrys chlorohalonatus IBT 40285]|uniref:Mitochondrial large ribosomal subunit n=1 Tax=Stachybotrys chlorohalonatus (strain IBT 40285) TaxID=1283841 RepID=A0A084Q9V5_STAC4|nr:hypothetical protein S40285_04732 [Stachybotrys chlorohalonata IBT 40285]
MSLRLAARRLAPTGTIYIPNRLVDAQQVPNSTTYLAGSSSPLPTATSSLLTGGTVTYTQRRQKWTDRLWRKWGGKSKAETDTVAPELNDPEKRKTYMQRNMRENTEGNIFEDEIQAAQGDNEASLASPVKTQDRIALVVDPDPRSRVRWQRKKVIQMVRKNGALTRDEKIRMTEREMLHKSEFLPTSLKKLVMLSRQIAGKPIDEAITQMKWSKKKMAAEVRYYLEEARDLAVAQRGMGLGAANGELLHQARKIQTRDGKWMEISDPTRIYIAQSWIGRGPWRGKELDYKGRGRTGIIKHPATSFSVLLKEEKSRIRDYEERVTKKSSQGPWVHLPNRKVYGQRPYYSW